MMRPDATEAQVRAADPAACTWLSANAGSGKTRVLTDRVARLLLNGVDPIRILCLTYTKAAASEMQNRLFARLGQWAMQPDADLHKALVDLGIEQTITAETLREARRLFARAIETPGGLRIQTIHAFCASILRRFPLEADVSPQFTEMEDRAAALLRDDIVDDMADRLAPDLVADLARNSTDEDFGQLTAEIASRRARFSQPMRYEDFAAMFGISGALTEDGILAGVFLGGEDALMSEAAGILGLGSPNDLKVQKRLQAAAALPGSLAKLMVMESALLRGGGSKDPSLHYTALGDALATGATRPGLAHLQDRLNALGLRCEVARGQRLALTAARRGHQLHRFATVFLAEYARRKQAIGALDFDDLISRARDLLTDPSVAQWVLFRLDGGIDHILVDEAQDTSPDQWKVIELLAQEFTSGRGARDVARTIFVVGDKKQSIYSFQGADVAEFDRMQAHFGERLAEVGTRLERRDLAFSFRSSPAILTLVDQTFDDRTMAGLGGPSRHLAFWPDMPGLVELWPPIAPAEKPEDADWFDPVDMIHQEHHAARLAGQIADRIARMISLGATVPHKGGLRPVTPGDFLILVRRRSDIFAEVIRACKARGLPIAGADRLKLGGELAVRDLAALMAFLATPEDDLSLAALLRSPLFGWGEKDLFRLAHGRRGFLWEALRELSAPEAQPTLAILRDLLNQADYLRPYDLIERMLTRHDGRRRLLARLGPEAEDGIDELLSQALAYERNEVPSLTGFLSWLQTDDIVVKRQTDSASDQIRVMTVHGAKGLEAPVVILPDTADRSYRDRDQIVVPGNGIATWRSPSADQAPPLIAATQAAKRAKSEEESLRLLYVAMTRAQSRLIVAAAGKLASRSGKAGKDTEARTPAWYDLIEAGMRRAGAETTADGGLRLGFGDLPARPDPIPPQKPAGERLADWVVTAAAPTQRPAQPVSPSNLGGAKAMPGDLAGDADAAMARGTRLHLLLEHLPAASPDLWDPLARALLPDATDVDDLLAEARTVIGAPHLEAIFAPGTLTEVAITGDLDGQRMHGTIDRLVMGADRVLAVDFKSNAVIPASPAEIPEGLRRQMRAYAVALAQIYPDRRIETAILWTRTALLMPVDT